ncbi:hypothetical protein A2524_00530 [Candidatus Wolfebacteria bacterium RIFOXYD12_FULL_48_21]|nr:MAG: hypothetical protein A2524_00530 [Candidatus Wolfebacteria bacterium RIFOXYD12_FULL_48_21]
MMDTTVLKAHFQRITEGVADREKNLDEKEERVCQLAVCGRKGLIKPPIGLFSKKCPGCGKKLSVEKWEAGGFPDYGDAYRYYTCSCGYEYGISHLVSSTREDCLHIWRR